MTTTKKIEALTLAGMLLLLSTVAHGANRGCYTADVPGEIVLPDRSRYASDTLRICTDQLVSPVSNLHRIFVGGRLVGMFVSVPRSAQGSLEAPIASFVFERSVGDELQLVSYVVNAGDKATIYEMRRTSVHTIDSIAKHGAGEREDMLVLVACAR